MYIGLHLNNETNGTGLLEFFDASEWEPVCFTEAFNEDAADVACQQLGYPFATNFTSVGLPYHRSGIGITISHCGGVNISYLFDCVDYESMTCQMQLQLTCYSSKYNYHKFSNYIANGM